MGEGATGGMQSGCSEGWEIRHTSATDTDGNPIDIEPKVYVTTNGGLTLAGAEALALTLLATYEEATD